MRNQSNRRRRLMRAAAPVREEFLREFPACMLCVVRPSVDVHEMNRGSGLRAKALTIPATWLAVCRRCHDDLDDASKWPLAAQLAVKRLRHQEAYDRLAVLRARVIGGDPKRGDNAVTEAEVNEWTLELLGRYEFSRPYRRATA